MASGTERRKVGLWAEWPPGSPWANEGMVRLLGFLIEGAAQNGDISFQIVVPRHIEPEARRDLAGLRAVEGLDYAVHAPEATVQDEEDVDQLMRNVVDFANAEVDVDGWIVLYPHFSYAPLLSGPKATILPDAITRVFPYFGEETWGPEGYHKAMAEKVSRVLAASDAVIVFSRHVAVEHAQRLFNVPPEKIHVAPHSMPDIAAALPFLVDRRRTDTSRRLAADILRQHARSRNLRYLADFPFEDVSYIVVSTQDRVTKNITVAARAVDELIRHRHKDIKLITTALLHFGAEWTPLPGFIEQRQIQNDVLSMHDLPRDVHAALYHCAAMAVHTSFFEGGRAPFPFSEAVSVGVPCLIADGPHTRELLEEAPELQPYVFDPQDSDMLANLIVATLASPSAVLIQQTAAFERMTQSRSWADVAREYAAAVPRKDSRERPEAR